MPKPKPNNCSVWLIRENDTDGMRLYVTPAGTTMDEVLEHYKQSPAVDICKHTDYTIERLDTGMLDVNGIIESKTLDLRRYDPAGKLVSTRKFSKKKLKTRRRK